MYFPGIPNTNRYATKNIDINIRFDKNNKPKYLVKQATSANNEIKSINLYDLRNPYAGTDFLGAKIYDYGKKIALRINKNGQISDIWDLKSSKSVHYLPCGEKLNYDKKGKIEEMIDKIKEFLLSAEENFYAEFSNVKRFKSILAKFENNKTL